MQIGMGLSITNFRRSDAVGGGGMSRAILTSNIIAAHQTDAESNFQGWSSTAGFTVFTETTPDAARARVETWRAAPNGLIKIICDWNGILDLTTSSFRGPANTALTADGASLDGYVRPTGGVWFEAAAGKLPVFGNSSIDIVGMPRIFFDGIGFAGKANGLNGDNIINVNIRATATYPIYACAAFKRSIFGLAIHRPADPVTEYVKALSTAFGYSLHVESCKFAGVRDTIQGKSKYLRVWKNHVRKNLSDFVTQFGFTSANWTGVPVWAWIEGNVVADLIDQSGFNGLHTDFYQCGTALDVHFGNSALVRWNVAHMKTSTSTDSGSQFVYMDDHTTASNNLVCHDNIAAFSAYNFAQLYDPSGAGNFYCEDNTAMRAGSYLQSGPQTYPRVNIPSIGIPATAGGSVSVSRNYFTLLANVPGITLTQTGNYYYDPRDNVVSGDGSSQPQSKRPEAVFSATFTRSGSDRLTYTIAGSDSADYATAFWAISDFFQPTAGWAVQAGANNPTSWAAAPTRPVGNTAPENTTAPAITGTAASGSTLTGTNGVWLGTPTPTYAYQWRRDGVNIAGATAITYTLVSGDIGTLTALVVTATNVASSVSAVSNTLGPVISPAVAPANTVLPVISGTATDRQTLSCTSGAWTGTPTIAYAYQWKRNGTNIAGATTATYLLVTADVATTTTCTVTATNAGGSVLATSAGVGPIAAYYAANFQSININGWSNTYAAPPTFAPNTAPERVTIERAGYGTDGIATFVLEDMILTQRIRQPYPSQTTLTTNQVAMSDYVYTTDTISGVTNNSSENSPKPIANWARPDDHMVVGNTVHLEVVAYHRNARFREEVACVEFSATDGTTTVTAIVAASTILGHPGDQFPVIGYAVDLDVSTLANQAGITCNAKVYPWIGGTAAVLDSAASSVAREFSPRIYLRNTALVAAPVFVYVNATTGNDTTGAVSTTAALAEATPCLTIAGAINRLVAVNGSIDGCIMRLMAGTHAFTTTAIVATRTQTTGELIITRDPNATQANAILSFGAATARPRLGAAGGWLRIKDISVLRTGVSQITGEASGLRTVFELVNLDNATFNATLSNSPEMHIGVAFTNTTSSLLSAGTREGRLYRGCTATATGSVEGWLVLGCSFNGGLLGYGTRTQSGAIVAFNRITNIGSAGGVVAFGASVAVAQVAVVQNIFEYTNATSGPTIRVSADGAAGSNTHVVMHNNTYAGFFNNGRDNIFYEDGPTRRTSKLMSMRGNIHVAINTKGDVFRGAVEAGADASIAIGNWSYKYGVGCEGNHSQFADALVSTLPAPSGSQDFPGMVASIGTSNSVRNDPLFVTYAGTTSGPTAGAGGGNYALQAGSPCKAKVARPALRFDMAGATRSATAASIGAYE